MVAKSGGLILEADEMWSFVGKRKCTWWIWVALDAETRQVVAMMAGDRTDFTARCLWESVPAEYRDGATIYTDFLATYRAVMPVGRHVACGKESGLTNHVERPLPLRTTWVEWNRGHGGIGSGLGVAVSIRRDY